MLDLSLVPLAMRTDPLLKRQAEQLGAFYQTDLPSPATFDEELVCRNVYWQGFEIVELPLTPQQGLAAVCKYTLENYLHTTGNHL